MAGGAPRGRSGSAIGVDVCTECGHCNEAQGKGCREVWGVLPPVATRRARGHQDVAPGVQRSPPVTISTLVYGPSVYDSDTDTDGA